MCEQCDKLRAELSELRQAVGLATTAVPDMVMDADHPIEMMHKVVGETRRLRGRVGVLEETIRKAITYIDHDEDVEADSCLWTAKPTWPEAKHKEGE